MKYGMKLFFVFCLSGMLSGSLLPTNIYAQEEIQTENENGDEESSESKSELPKSSNTAPVYHFSLDKFLTEDEIETAELKSENPNIRSRVTFADIMYEATKYEGLPYVWGGRYPSQGGFDCAGLCMYVYNKICGTSFDLINTNAAMLYTNHCTPVSESDAQPGDLVFFKGTYEAIDYISHVGIYCGNGIMFNAGDPIGYGYVHDVKNMYGGKAEVLFGRVNNVDVVVSCQSGFNNINGNWYYYDENGNPLYGWQTINDKLYYFNKWGRMSIGWTFISGNWYYFDANGAMQKGWILDNTYYLNEDGIMLTGWQTIDDAQYYFDGSGKKLTSCWIDNKYVLEDGKLARNQWIDDCYVDDNGLWVPSLHPYEWKMVDGKKKYYSNKTNSFVINELKQIDGAYYYFDSEGSVATGFTTIDKNKYYFDASGKMVTGWIQIDGTYYFFNASGIMKTSSWIGDYYLNGEGKMLVNAFTPDGYYVNGNGAYLRNQWFINNGNYYFVNACGKVLKNVWVGAYYLGCDGVMYTNAFTPDGYYVGSDGAYITNRWFKDHGKDYYANGYGKIVKGAWVGSYYLGKDGAMLTNTFTPDGFYVGADGVYLRNQKIIVDGKDYYLNASGIVAKNQWVGDYFIDVNGNVVKNHWVGDYWCGEDGKYVKSSWVDNNRYYVDARGVYVRNAWIKVDGKYYYMEASGLTKKNAWQGAYYLGNDGVMYTHSFTPDGYYVGSDGAYYTNRWIGDYYLNGSGIKVTNAWVGNYWCGSDGKYVKSSWVDHDRYYVDSNGIYVAGALK